MEEPLDARCLDPAFALRLRPHGGPQPAQCTVNQPENADDNARARYREVTGRKESRGGQGQKRTLPFEALDRQDDATSRNPMVGADRRRIVGEAHVLARRPHGARKTRRSNGSCFTIRHEGTEKTGHGRAAIDHERHRYREYCAVYAGRTVFVHDAAEFGRIVGAAEEDGLEITSKVILGRVVLPSENPVEQPSDRRNVAGRHGARTAAVPCTDRHTLGYANFIRLHRHMAPAPKVSAAWRRSRRTKCRSTLQEATTIAISIA